MGSCSSLEWSADEIHETCSKLNCAVGKMWVQKQSSFWIRTKNVSSPEISHLKMPFHPCVDQLFLSGWHSDLIGLFVFQIQEQLSIQLWCHIFGKQNLALHTWSRGQRHTAWVWKPWGTGHAKGSRVVTGAGGGGSPTTHFAPQHMKAFSWINQPSTA